MCEGIETRSCDENSEHMSSKDRTGLKSGWEADAVLLVCSFVAICDGRGFCLLSHLAKQDGQDMGALFIGPDMVVELVGPACCPRRCGRVKPQCVGVWQRRRKRD